MIRGGWAVRAVVPVLALAFAACGDGETSAAASAAEGERGSGGSAAEVLADSLVDAWIGAAGGLAAWDSVRSARYTITTVWYDSTGQVERMRPRRVEFRKAEGAEQARIERPEAEGLYVQVFTGDTAWAALNGRPLPPGHRAVEETEYVGRDVVYWFGLPYKLRDPGVNRSARELPGGGHEVRVTFGEEGGAHPGDRYFYYFLDGDPWPDEVHRAGAHGGGPEPDPLVVLPHRRPDDVRGHPDLGRFGGATAEGAAGGRRVAEPPPGRLPVHGARAPVRRPSGVAGAAAAS